MMRQSIEAWIYHPEDREILLLKVENEEETGLVLDCSNLTSLGDFTVKIDENLSIHKNLFLVLTEQKDIQISDEHVGAQWIALDKVSSQLYWPSNQATFEMISEKL